MSRLGDWGIAEAVSCGSAMVEDRAERGPCDWTTWTAGSGRGDEIGRCTSVRAVSYCYPVASQDVMRLLGRLVTETKDLI